MYLCKKIIAVFFLFCVIQTQSQAEEKILFVKKETVDLSATNPTPLEMRQSIIKSIIHYNWKITEQSNNRIIATYDDNYLIYIDFLDSSLSLKGAFRTSSSKVKSSIPNKFRKWFKSIKKDSLKRLELSYYLRQAEKLSTYP